MSDSGHVGPAESPGVDNTVVSWHHGLDPDEMVNLAMDNRRRGELRNRFEALRALEAAELGPR